MANEKAFSCLRTKRGRKDDSFHGIDNATCRTRRLLSLRTYSDCQSKAGKSGKGKAEEGTMPNDYFRSPFVLLLAVGLFSPYPIHFSSLPFPMKGILTLGKFIWSIVCLTIPFSAFPLRSCHDKPFPSSTTKALVLVRPHRPGPIDTQYLLFVECINICCYCWWMQTAILTLYSLDSLSLIPPINIPSEKFIVPKRSNRNNNERDFSAFKAQCRVIQLVLPCLSPSDD
jgi:hypothetical protein